MFGLFRKFLGRGDLSETSESPGSRRVGVSAADLKSVATLGPRVVELLKARAGVAEAGFEAANGLIRVTYDDGETQILMLDNLLSVLRQQDGATLAGYLENYLSRPRFTAAEDGYLLPVLKPASYIAQTRQSLIDAGIATEEMPLPYHLDFAPGLVMVFVRDTPSRMHVLSGQDVEAMGLDTEKLVERSLEQLAAFLEDHPLGMKELADGLLVQFELDGNYETSTAFLTGLWEGVGQHLGGLPGVAFVARNIVLAVNAENPEAVRLLRDMLSPEAGDPPPYPIAPHDIYVPSRDGGWQVLPDDDLSGRVLH
ncbi:MAG: hypothetical protein ACK5JR_14030 [Tropicimonas sp.]|uniref:hypothetical protein n=1 Tax=Tropicimonas sp. TaxID=2067044 RepID=UPI003A85B114